MFCPKCGVKLPENGKFCPKCGYKCFAEKENIFERMAKKKIKLEDKKMYVVLSIAIITVLCLVIFNYSYKMQIVGIWKSQGRRTLQFQKDGTYVEYDPVMGTTVYGSGFWELNANRLAITDGENTNWYTIQINGGEMIMEVWDSSWGDYRNIQYVKVE